MQVSYLDPVKQQSVRFDSPEALARSIADTLPRGSRIRFLNQPFSLDLKQLKSLLIHFEREQITEHYQFICEVDPAELNAEVCQQLENLAIKTLLIQLDSQNPPLDSLAQALALTRQFDCRLVLQLTGSPTPALGPLAELYFFLEAQLGSYELHYASGHFEQASVDFRFRFLAELSGQAHAAQRTEALMHRHYYLALQEFLSFKISSRVQHILELNPWADWHYYRQFNRAHQSWRTTLLDLPDYRLPLSALKAEGRTFDAMVLFQGLPSLRSPRDALQQLKAFSRATTEWVVFHYNLSSLSSLAQLVQNQFQSALHYSGWWPYPQPQTLARSQALLAELNLELEWIPTRLTLAGLEPQLQQLETAFDAEWQLAWQTYRQQADILAWTAYGSGQLNLKAGFDSASEGFVEGFL